MPTCHLYVTAAAVTSPVTLGAAQLPAILLYGQLPHPTVVILALPAFFFLPTLVG